MTIPLSTIVLYKNLLDTLGSEPAAGEILNKLKNILYVVSTSEIQIEGAVDQLTDSCNQVNANIDQFNHLLEQLRQSVQQRIEQQEPEYFQKCLNLYNHGYRNDSVEHIRDRRINLDPVASVIIQQRLKLYTNWQAPGMVIRPVHARYVEDLVACDPMYFVDTDMKLLDLTESWFTSEYQRRLRRYVIAEYTFQPAFINLPNNQFGLIYAFHFFNYRPWTVLQQYLKECFDLLRPGGVLAFTYNNCDIAGRVKKVEHYSGSYTPGRLVRKYALELGYEILFDFDDDSDTSWLELRRPGEYSSIRGGQTLAVVTQRDDVSSVPNELDRLPISAYNTLNILLSIAQRIGIDLKQCVVDGRYSEKKLRRAIEQQIYPKILTEQMIRELFNQRTDP